jgi:hypothetical protein
VKTFRKASFAYVIGIGIGIVGVDDRRSRRERKEDGAQNQRQGEPQWVHHGLLSLNDNSIEGIQRRRVAIRATRSFLRRRIAEPLSGPGHHHQLPEPLAGFRPGLVVGGDFAA